MVESADLDKQYTQVYSSYMTVVSEEAIKDIDQIHHNKEIEGVEYKYGIPVKNDRIMREIFKPPEEEELPPTPMEQLMEVHGLDAHSSFESLILKHTDKYRYDIDMYGEFEEVDTLPAILEEGVPIPREILSNTMIMETIRNNVVYNPDVPGQMMDVNPMKFVAGAALTRP